MIILSSIPIILSSFLIAAHFFRIDLQFAVFFCLLSLLLLFFKKSWIPKIKTFFLFLYSVVWSMTMLHFIDQYKLQERPFGKLVIILLSVIAFTLLSSVVFKT